MKNALKKYFIPNEENEYRPHFLRGRAIVMIAIVIVFLFLGSLFHASVIQRSNLFAAILPKVLADLANEDRMTEGIPVLAINSLLEGVARKKALDMSQKGYFAHTSPDGVTPWYWFTETGYLFLYAGENLAIDFSDSEGVNKAWLNSPKHRANILNKNFTEIGIATARGRYQGRETTFVVQMFGTPIPVIPSAQAVAQKKEIKATSKGASAPSIKPIDTKVLGVERQEAPAVIPKVETVYVDDSFVAVKNLDYVAPSVNTEPSQSAPVSYASFFERLFVAPQKLLLIFYAIVGTIIVTAIILHIVIEIRRQHPLHIAYGFLLLMFIGILIYGQKIILIAPSIAAP